MTGPSASQLNGSPTERYVAAMRPFFHPVASVHELDDAGVDAQGTRRVLDRVLLGRRIVVTRLDGNAVALDGTCPHRGAALALGWLNDDASAVVCPYHGFEWGASGRIQRIAALAAAGKALPTGRAWCVDTFPTVERYGYVWVALAPEARFTLEVDEADDPGFLAIARPPASWDAGCGRIVDASLDTYHFAFTHRATIGDPNHPEAPTSRTDTDDDRFYLEYSIEQPASRSVTYADPPRARNDTAVAGASTVTSSYQFWARPSTVFMRKTNPFVRFGTLVAIHPVSPGRSIVYRTIFIDRAWAVDLDEFIATQDLVNEEDRAIVESARPWELRSDLDAELHAMMDRPTVAFRRWLGTQGIEVL